MINSKVNIINTLTISYFVLAFLEILAEFFILKPLILILKPTLPLLLITLYFLESKVKNSIIIIAFLLSSITNILFIPDNPTCLLYGILVFTIYRIISIYIVFSYQKLIDFIPIIIATAPFLLIFFYLFSETSEIPEDSVYILIFQNLLISLFAGVALSGYVMNDNKQNSILLISALLFVMLQFVVFIEKYFLIDEYREFFRPLAMTLNCLAFFSFYKYIIEAEKSNNN
jgi:hypothetical protein